MKYTLCCDRRFIRNEVEGYPEDFNLDNSVIVVGSAEILDEAIHKLNLFEDRYEAGVRLRAIGRLKNPDSRLVKKVLDQLNSESQKIELSILKSAIGDAQLINAHLYLGTPRDVEAYFPLILCIDPRDKIKQAIDEEKQEGNDNYNPLDKYILGPKIGELNKIPRLILQEKLRHTVDSIRDEKKLCKPQITIPTKSVFNHYRFGLGRYDNK